MVALEVMEAIIEVEMVEGLIKGVSVDHRNFQTYKLHKKMQEIWNILFIDQWITNEVALFFFLYFFLILREMFLCLSHASD